MTDQLFIASTKAVEALDNATFLWRKGRWHMQQAGHTGLKPVPLQAAKILEHFRQAGRLSENSPGLFQLSRAPQPAVFDDAESPLMRLARLRQPDGSAILDSDQLQAGKLCASTMSARIMVKG